MSNKQKNINIAVIGCGNRGRYVVGNLLKDAAGKVKVVALFDPEPEAVTKAVEHWAAPTANCASSYQAAIDTETVDWVMIFSPNIYHKAQIVYAFKQNKHVFSEKPLATTITDCQEIFEVYQQSNRFFATGFVLRYSPIYRKAKELLKSGKLGKIISIDANENITPGHGGYIMANWRRLTKYSGPHILEKCCHDLDLLNWFCESIPTKIAAFGGLNLFTPENESLRKKYGAKTFTAWDDPHAMESPFTSDKDIKDNQVCIMEYRNQIRVMFQATMSNAIPERRIYFSCSEGTMILEIYSGILKYRSIGDEGITIINLSGDGHGGGDNFMTKELYDTMSNNVSPKCSGREGLESAVAAIMLDEAVTQSKVMDLEPVWSTLKR